MLLIWFVNKGLGRSASKGLAVSIHCLGIQSLAFFAGFGKTRYGATFDAAFVAIVDHSLVADELVSDHQGGLTLRLDTTLPSGKHVQHCCYGSPCSTFMCWTSPQDQIFGWLDSDIVTTSSTRMSFDFTRQYHYVAFILVSCQLLVAPPLPNLPGNWAFFGPEDSVQDRPGDRNLWVAKVLGRFRDLCDVFLSRPEPSGLHMLVFFPLFLWAKSPISST